MLKWVQRVTGLQLVTLVAVIGFLILIVLAACTPSAVGTTGTSFQQPYTVVMNIDGYEVRRYENDRAICFSWNTYHGSVTCQDKPQ